MNQPEKEKVEKAHGLLDGLIQRLQDGEATGKRNQETGIPASVCLFCEAPRPTGKSKRFKWERVRELWNARELLGGILGKKDPRAEEAKRYLEERHGKKP